MAETLTTYLSVTDRARIDNLSAELARYNDRRNVEVLVSCTEAARLLRKTPQTISQWLKEGRLHKRTIGESVGIPLSEVREAQEIH